MNWEYETDGIIDCVINGHVDAIPEMKALDVDDKLLLGLEAYTDLNKALLSILEAAEKKQGQTQLAAKLRVAVSTLEDIRDYLKSGQSPVRQWAERALARIKELEEENGL